MIRFVSPELEARLLDCCNTDDAFSAKLYSQYQTYGAQSGIIHFWMLFCGETPVGAVSGCGDCFTLAARSVPDADELAAFLRASGCRTIEAERTLLGGIGTVVRSGLILRADQPPEQAEGVKRAEKLPAVWELLCEADPEFAKEVCFDAWLTEFSHKIRHGLAECYTLEVEEKIISTSSILFRNDQTTVIAAVATHPAFRGRGLGQRVVHGAVASAFLQELSPQVLIKTPELLAFYAACGFRPAGEWVQAALWQPQDSDF